MNEIWIGIKKNFKLELVGEAVVTKVIGGIDWERYY